MLQFPFVVRELAQVGVGWIQLADHGCLAIHTGEKLESRCLDSYVPRPNLLASNPTVKDRQEFNYQRAK